MGCWDGGEDFGDRESLAYDAGGHDKSTSGGGWGAEDTGVYGAGHAGCVFDAALAGDSVSTAGVDDDGSKTFATALLEDFTADGYGSGLERVLSEDGGGGTGG